MLLAFALLLQATIVALLPAVLVRWLLGDKAVVFVVTPMLCMLGPSAPRT